MTKTFNIISNIGGDIRIIASFTIKEPKNPEFEKLANDEFNKFLDSLYYEED